LSVFGEELLAASRHCGEQLLNRLRVRHEDLHAEPKDGRWLKSIVEAVLAASSKDALKAGIPYPGRRGKSLTFDLDDFDSAENEPQKEFAVLLEGMREGPNVSGWKLEF
jgi:hypothetical protein